MNGPVTERPPRRMPLLRTVHRYWMTGRRSEAMTWFGQVDLDEMSCYACGWWTESVSLERAHLIDRVYGGEDQPPNLVPLCRRCHREMPSFRPGEERLALDWVKFHRTCVEALMPQILEVVGHIERTGGVPVWLTRPNPGLQDALEQAASGYLGL